MTRIKLALFITSFFLFSLPVLGQSIKGYSKEQLAELSVKVEDQVRFLEFLLNTLGDAQSSARDKDVIIRESYLKIFRDGKVQIEDDLLADRKVVTNKDVQAYLKDIEFFYKSVAFKFKIREIKPTQKENGEIFFLVSLDRSLTAIGITGEKVTTTQLRFIEVNVDEKSQDLKIASIYTTKVSRDEELDAWWKGLDIGWKSYFKTRFQISELDSISPSDLYRFVAIDSLNLSNNQLIKDLTPLAELRDLKFLDISHTRIVDLSPIANVTFLEDLNLSNTATSAIQFIKYSDRLKALDISATGVEDISELSNLKSLVYFKADNTPIQNFSVLNEFKELQQLYLRGSGFNNMGNITELGKLTSLSLSRNFILNFSVLARLKSLVELDLSETNCEDLSSLAELTELAYLDITSTAVSDLSPLAFLSNLRKVLADETKLSTADATLFTRTRPEVLLIHHVKDLKAWWDGLTLAWKNALIKSNPALGVVDPGIEVLTQLVTKTNLSLEGAGFETLAPLTRFVSLTELNLSDNPFVSDLLPLTELKTLKILLAKNTGIQDVSILKDNKALVYLDFESSPVISIFELAALPDLKYLNVNKSQVPSDEFPRILLARPDLLVIYRSEELLNWWSLLDSNWKEILKEKFKITGEPSLALLHQLTSVSELVLEGTSIIDLSPVLLFSNLRSLHFFDAPLVDLGPISQMKLLTTLRLSQLPATNYFPISQLTNLIDLDISTTGIEELTSLSNLVNLEKLVVSGTNIKSLKGIEGLVNLVELDFASTDVRSLKPVEGIVGLKKVTCFNTRLSPKAVEAFMFSIPTCEVRYY